MRSISGGQKNKCKIKVGESGNRFWTNRIVHWTAEMVWWNSEHLNIVNQHDPCFKLLVFCWFSWCQTLDNVPQQKFEIVFGGLLSNLIGLKPLFGPNFREF